MVRIGVVDLDSSHPQAFVKILRTVADVQVTSLWDGRDVWSEAYDREFAEREGIPHRCAHLEEMPEFVDAAMIHGVDWDRHCDKAAVFLKAGKPVLIDKPIVGSERDCRRLLEMQEEHGTFVFGGSSLRYAGEVATLRKEMGSRQKLLSVVASGPGDFFSYGIHTTEMLQGFLGLGARSVKILAQSRTPVLAITYADGFVALVQLQMPFHEWSLCAYGTEGLRMTTVDPEKLYRPFLEAFLSLLKGQKPSGQELAGPIEAVRIHMAASIAQKTGQEVFLEGLPLDAGFDGKAFAEEYAAAKRSQSVPQR